jgi:RNA polymerase sigma-70 factor, ECF subfamily
MKSDPELLAEFRRGDRRAFHKLVRRYHVRLLNFFYPLTASQNLADVLTQKVFLRIYTENEGRSETSHSRRTPKFQIYLFRLGYFCWLDYMRLVHRPALPRVISHTASPQTIALTQQTVNEPTTQPTEALIELLASLPDELKAIVVMREINGLNYGEISGVLDVSEASVKSRMNEAFKHLSLTLRSTSTATTAPDTKSSPTTSAGSGTGLTT